MASASPPGGPPGYDVFLQARQHGGCRDGRHRPCAVSEYGDWEYYAMNAGLDQTAWTDLTPAESNSRQLRWQEERALLQQATNFQEAHDDNLGTIAFADGLWVMYDYNRGYAPDVESSGCMDLFRLPKFSYHFFRSQRPPATGPVVFIASHWMPGSAAEVRVFSNCEEVALSLDGRLLERRGPDRSRIATRLAHPPFTFGTDGFRPGRLEAVGYVGGRPVARHAVRTPGPIERLTLAVDLAGRPLDGGQRDVLFATSLRDAHGTIVPDAWENVAFGVAGESGTRREEPLPSEAGISSIVADVRPGRGRFRCVQSPRSSRAGAPPEYLVRRSHCEGRASAPAGVYHRRDGAGPELAATRGGSRRRVLRAGLVVQGKVLPRWPRRRPSSDPRHRSAGEAGAISSVSCIRRRSGDPYRLTNPVPYAASPARASPARTRGAPAPTTDSR